MVRWSYKYCDSDGLRKWLLILDRKYQGTTPGNCKVVSSNLQSELIFRVRSYDFLHRNNRPLPLPLLDKPKPLNSQIPREVQPSNASGCREQRSHRILAHGDESSNHGRKGLGDAATRRLASCCPHGAIPRDWSICALISLLCRSLCSDLTVI